MQENSAIGGRRMAWILSLAGFVPLIGMAIILAVIGKEHVLFISVVEMFKTWSAIILSFLGGIRWGICVNEEAPKPAELFAAILPSAIGWATLLMPEPVSILVLLVAFAAQGAWDSFSINSGAAPLWFGKLRIWLTMLVALAHILVIVAVF